MFPVPGETVCATQLLQPEFDRDFCDAYRRRNFYKQLSDPIGQTIRYQTPDGREASAYEIKARKPTKSYVFVIHEWWGLNDYVKQEAEKIYTELGNVNVIALDLYDGKVATSRDSAAVYMQSVTSDRAEAIIKGLLKHAGKKANIATIGWCFGGGWSLQAAILAGRQAKACVMYYGMPEKDLSKLQKLYAPVLFIWPEQDKWINQDVVDEFRKNMQKCGKEYEVISYSADHAFANPSNPKYSKAFADDAFQHAIKLMREELN